MQIPSHCANFTHQLFCSQIWELFPWTFLGAGCVFWAQNPSHLWCCCCLECWKIPVQGWPEHLWWGGALCQSLEGQSKVWVDNCKVWVDNCEAWAGNMHKSTLFSKSRHQDPSHLSRHCLPCQISENFAVFCLQNLKPKLLTPDRALSATTQLGWETPKALPRGGFQGCSSPRVAQISQNCSSGMWDNVRARENPICPFSLWPEQFLCQGQEMRLFPQQLFLPHQGELFSHYLIILQVLINHCLFCCFSRCWAWTDSSGFPQLRSYSFLML